MSMNYKRIQANLEEINNYIKDLERKCLKKTIFFTGANGYLGTRIKQRLVQAGHTVIAWDVDLTKEIIPTKNDPDVDLIIHFGKPEKSGSSEEYYQAWDKVNMNIYKFAKAVGCPIINASTEAIELDIPCIENIINTGTDILKKDIFSIQKFNEEMALVQLPNAIVNLRIPLVLDESILEYKPKSWYAKIKAGEADISTNFYASNKEERERGEIPTIPIISLDRFTTVTLAKIYEVLKEDTGVNGLTKRSPNKNKSTFKYPSINLELPDIVKKIKAGFWA